MTVLLDANVLIALVVEDHVHHDAAERWVTELAVAAISEGQFATCPITQGAMIRFLMRGGVTGPAARTVLLSVIDRVGHVKWSDDIGYGGVDLDRVLGHRQVTDAYLVGLAHARGGKVATFDRGLCALYPAVAELVPT